MSAGAAPVVEGEVLYSESGVNRRGVGFVLLTWGGQSGQLSPDEARALALQIIGAADAAETDALAVKVLGGPGDRAAIELLRAVRAARSAS